MKFTNSTASKGFWRKITTPLCAWGLLLTGVTAFGQTDSVDNEGQVAVGGEQILTVRFPAAGMSIKERADAITDRLVLILSNPNLKPSDIQVVPLTNHEAKITVGNRLLVTVDRQTARYNQTTPFLLAQSWAAHLRRVLPRVNVKPNSNLGEPAPNSASRAVPSLPFGV